MKLSPIDRLVSRLERPRRTSRGVIARCPAHDDRSPSLSVSEGHDGRVLVRCFAGCEASQIVQALHLSLTDLFDAPRAKPERNAERRAPTTEEIRGALTREAERVLRELADRGIIGALTHQEQNSIRKRVARRLGIELPPLRVPLWDSGPHARDPLWPTLMERHWRNLWIERAEVVPPPLDEIGMLRGRERLFFIETEERAARELHEIAKVGMGLKR